MSNGSIWTDGYPEDYYIWITELVNLDSHRGYSKLVSFLFDTEFFWEVALDRNRAGDGKELRFDWVMWSDYHDDDSWVDTPCSVLEMLIALARRIRVDIMPDYDIELADWFWKIISNMGLDRYDNSHFNSDEICEKLCYFSEKKQHKMLIFNTKTEKSELESMDIWNQMQRWLAENYDF